ncbi:hypothetical protein [Streptomyces sp. R08]|uniref:Uncharacterized protein n=1 Tax=Streptomyces sp. R08 TaxID=3238624 RepID=A0AB39M338_9ACTN
MRYPLETDIESYDRKHQEHIEAHAPWSPHSLTNREKNPKSPSAFAEGVSDLAQWLRALSVVAVSEDAASVIEYRTTEPNYIIKLFGFEDGRIEATIIDPEPNENGRHKIVTTYDTVTIAKIKAKLKRKEGATDSDWS